MKILVYHSYYGCDTGCCGHRIEFHPEDDDSGYECFEFGHCPEDVEPKQFARDLAEEYIRDPYDYY